RVFTNAFSFFLNSSSSAAIVLLDEPEKGYPDPIDVVVRLPRQTEDAKTIPLAKKTTADTHPLKGSRVFISSGGADTVVVLDFHKAAKHVEANAPPPSFGFVGGGFQGFGGGSFGSYGGFGGANLGGGFSGRGGGGFG